MATKLSPGDTVDMTGEVTRVDEDCSRAIAWQRLGDHDARRASDPGGEVSPVRPQEADRACHSRADRWRQPSGQQPEAPARWQAGTHSVCGRASTLSSAWTARAGVSWSSSPPSARDRPVTFFRCRRLPLGDLPRSPAVIAFPCRFLFVGRAEERAETLRW